MTIQRVNPWSAQVERERNAFRALAAKQAREIRVLKAQLEAAGNPLFASAACPVCFRDVPHAEHCHEHDQTWISQLPANWEQECL